MNFGMKNGLQRPHLFMRDIDAVARFSKSFLTVDRRVDRQVSDLLLCPWHIAERQLVVALRFNLASFLYRPKDGA